MEAKERQDLASRLRGIANTFCCANEAKEKVRALANELDPPKLKYAPGTPVIVEISGDNLLRYVTGDGLICIDGHKAPDFDIKRVATDSDIAKYLREYPECAVPAVRAYGPQMFGAKHEQ